MRALAHVPSSLSCSALRIDWSSVHRLTLLTNSVSRSGHAVPHSNDLLCLHRASGTVIDLHVVDVAFYTEGLSCSSTHGRILGATVCRGRLHFRSGCCWKQWLASRSRPAGKSGMILVERTAKDAGSGTTRGVSGNPGVAGQRGGRGCTTDPFWSREAEGERAEGAQSDGARAGGWTPEVDALAHLTSPPER
jgi:hypothetical protein